MVPAHKRVCLSVLLLLLLLLPRSGVVIRGGHATEGFLLGENNRRSGTVTDSKRRMQERLRDRLMLSSSRAEDRFRFQNTNAAAITTAHDASGNQTPQRQTPVADSTADICSFAFRARLQSLFLQHTLWPNVRDEHLLCDLCQHVTREAIAVIHRPQDVTLAHTMVIVEDENQRGATEGKGPHQHMNEAEEEETQSSTMSDAAVATLTSIVRDRSCDGVFDPNMVPDCVALADRLIPAAAQLGALDRVVPQTNTAAPPAAVDGGGEEEDTGDTAAAHRGGEDHVLEWSLALGERAQQVCRAARCCLAYDLRNEKQEQEPDDVNQAATLQQQQGSGTSVPCNNATSTYIPPLESSSSSTSQENAKADRQALMHEKAQLYQWRAKLDAQLARLRLEQQALAQDLADVQRQQREVDSMRVAYVAKLQNVTASACAGRLANQTSATAPAEMGENSDSAGGEGQYGGSPLSSSASLGFGGKNETTGSQTASGTAVPPSKRPSATPVPPAAGASSTGGAGNRATSGMKATATASPTAIQGDSRIAGTAEQPPLEDNSSTGEKGESDSTREEDEENNGEAQGETGADGDQEDEESTGEGGEGEEGAGEKDAAEEGGEDGNQSGD